MRQRISAENDSIRGDCDGKTVQVHAPTVMVSSLSKQKVLGGSQRAAELLSAFETADAMFKAPDFFRRRPGP